MNQVVLTTVLIALLGTAIYMAYTCDTKEGFWMTPSRQVKAEKMFQNPNTQDFFQVPNFQGILSPRFSNVNYGADLRSKFPNSTKDPLSEKPNLSITRLRVFQVAPITVQGILDTETMRRINVPGNTRQTGSSVPSTAPKPTSTRRSVRT